MIRSVFVTRENVDVDVDVDADVNVDVDVDVDVRVDVDVDVDVDVRLERLQPQNHTAITTVTCSHLISYSKEEKQFQPT